LIYMCAVGRVTEKNDVMEASKLKELDCKLGIVAIQEE
jgi:hypothetical protein